MPLLWWKLLLKNSYVGPVESVSSNHAPVAGNGADSWLMSGVSSCKRERLSTRPTTEEGKVRAASDVNRSEVRQANKLLGAAEHETPNVRRVKRVTQNKWEQ